MTVKELARTLCSMEGLKVQVAIGDMREIIGLLSDIFCREGVPGDTSVNLYKNGYRRLKKFREAQKRSISNGK